MATRLINEENHDPDGCSCGIELFESFINNELRKFIIDILSSEFKGAGI